MSEISFQVDVYLLPQKAFPTGGLYFKNKTWVKETKGMHVIIHNNYIIGFEKKTKRFRDYGLWLVDDHSSESPIGKLSWIGGTLLTSFYWSITEPSFSTKQKGILDNTRDPHFILMYICDKRLEIDGNGGWCISEDWTNSQAKLLNECGVNSFCSLPWHSYSLWRQLAIISQTLFEHLNTWARDLYFSLFRIIQNLYLCFFWECTVATAVLPKVRFLSWALPFVLLGHLSIAFDRTSCLLPSLLSSHF